MANQLQPVRGTRDLTSKDAVQHFHVVETARRVSRLYGFSEWQTPIFEDTRVFSRTRAKAPFMPIDPGNVRAYLCGPTVYDRAHIGNARNVVIFDVLIRLPGLETGFRRVVFHRLVMVFHE